MKSFLQSFRFFVLICLCSSTLMSQDRIPSRAWTYQQILHAEVERTWGLRIPPDVVAISAGTIHQESAWNPLAHSAYASGLTQFTDSTWADMLVRDPSLAGLGNVWNPHAAIRAMVVYHHALWSLFPTIKEDRWAFVLSSYNGGYGNVIKDQKLCALIVQCLPNVWWNNVELHSKRLPQFFKENRGYPRNILKRWVPLYLQF